MGVVQQSYNSLFNTSLAAAMVGSRAFQESALGQRMKEARVQRAELKNINKAIQGYGGIDADTPEPILKKYEDLAKRGSEGALNLVSLTGKEEDLERATKGLQTRTTIEAAVSASRGVKEDIAEIQKGINADAAEAEERYSQAQAHYESMSPSERAAAAAATALTEASIEKFMRGGK